jgi:AcrR family transcriptional regulator
MARTQDPAITDALLAAARELVAERGFGAVSLDAVADRAGVGKPAIYRRFDGKPALLAAAVTSALPAMDETPARKGGHRARLRALIFEGLPDDADGYVAMIGGLFAEGRRHPELVDAFRAKVLLPRRAIVADAVRAAQADGDLDSGIDPIMAVDLIGGPFLARVYAGLDVGPAWREEMFRAWWQMLRPR